ncbi:capping protein, Arp2/3 and myosin-I linker protein 2-like [Eublepharis macularius]|uniref:Capping protein, Arp2/3 and myosin-I linker protein 2-like n=1 Tax=Eublepharis macularius TaxID=481883 RepID=A0AA97KH52_EUBMA|nr:capping protein, Arp2/3 and myosin-I linker protein 2-like [Eublepharis macularius]
MAASLREISPELRESITDFLGMQEVSLLTARLHVKSKVEDTVLVLLPWRALVLLAKLPIKVQGSFSFLALQLIKMGEASQVVIETDTTYEFEFLSLDDLEYVVIHMIVFLKKIFPDSSPWHLLQNASPSLLDRIQKISNSLEEVLKENRGPCGGFSEMYAVLCDYSGLPLREEIQWDVDNIYHKQECKEFNLQDFAYLDSHDLALSVAALSFNQWFTRLYCKDVKLNLDILDQILYVLSKSVTLEELVLENCGLKLEFAQRMAQVLSNHPDSALNMINLSGNLLEDRGIIALSQNFERCFKSLQSLSLARTSLTSKGMIALCQSLVSNGLFRTSLGHLDLSGNPGSLATDDAGGLYFFLSQPNALAHLDLSGTDCALDLVFGALAGGCCGSLVRLNLSKNVYSHKKNKEVPPAIGKFFRKASVLQHVSLSGTKLPPEALRDLLQGLARNSQLSGLHLDLSSCELRSAGAQVIQDLVVDASSIGDLNLADNGFDSDMVTLVLAISRSRSIRHVALGKNFNIRSREALDDILHRIVQLTQDEDCSVKSLSVAESRLKLGTSILLDSLGSSNSNLVTLDISGNAMGDFGAKILAKALLMNTTLRTLIWDRNNTTVYGFLDVARALERNFTLKVMPLPVTDVAQAYRSHPEKVEEVVHKIQSYLTRNQMQETFPKEKLQLQSESTASSSEQAVKHACQSVQENIAMLSSVQDVEVKADIRWAEEAMEDADLALSHKMAAAWKHSFHMSTLPTFKLNSLLELDLKVEAEDNKIGTPQAVLSLSRASSAKSRPASTKDAEAGSGLLPHAEPAPAQSLMDLPTAGEKLEHYTRGRPRPNRRNRQPPSKPNVQPAVRENDEDRSIARLDEGLDDFFTKKVIHEHLPPVSSEASLAFATPTSSGSRTLKKKIGHFFAFKKPKSSRATRPEKEPEGSPSATTRGRRLMLSDILRAPSKASESTKGLSKSEEGGLAGESRSPLEQSQTPDSSRRTRANYSREGKSQSLILLSGEDEETLGVRHEKKRPFERSDGELPSSFEQRVHVMLHRIGVTKVLSSEGKKKQSKDGEIKKAGSDGDIVDSSAESPPCSLKSRTHSMSTGKYPSVRLGPADATGGSGESRLSWKTLGKQLNAELKGKCSELSSSPRRAFAIQEPASPREQKGRESWTSSLPRIGRSAAGAPPVRRTSNAEEGRAFSELQNSYADVNTIAGDNQPKPKPRLKPVANRRAMSVHEEQLRDQASAVELHHTKLPLCLQRSPILKWKVKPKSLLEPELPASSDSAGSPPQERTVAATESRPRADTGEERQPALEQTLENAQNTALDQRTAVPPPKSPAQEH